MALVVVVVLATSCLLTILWGIGSHLRAYYREEVAIERLAVEGAIVVQADRPERWIARAIPALGTPRHFSISVAYCDVNLANALPLQVMCLYLDDTVLDPDSAAAISQMDLMHLTLSRVSAPRGLWTQISKLKKLELLSVDQIELGDEGLLQISQISSLHTLGLRKCGVTRNGLGALRTLPCLRTLHIEGLSDHRGSMRFFKDLVGLEVLSLKSCGLNDSDTIALAQLTLLSSLDVSGNPITDKGLAELCGMKNLTSLALNGTKITDAGLRYVEERDAPITLEVSHTAVSPEAAMRVNHKIWGPAAPEGPP
jgi:hypothetical protein